MLNFIKLFKSLPIQLIVCLFVGLCFGNTLSLDVANSIYTVSCFIKDILMYVLPFVIFTYLWAAIVSFGNRGIALIIATLCLIIIANATAVLTSYGLSILILPSIIDGAAPHITHSAIETVVSLWTIPNWQYIKPLHGLFAGIGIGIISLISRNHQLIAISLRLRQTATLILQKGFIPFLPLYVLGFVIKLSRDGQLGYLMHSYAHTFVFICGLIVAYLLFWYTVGSCFKVKKTIQSIKEMIPAGITGFMTMSSSATMPITLTATEKNLNDRPFANFIIPIATNWHLVGDGISLTVTALSLLLMFGQPLPTLSVFLIYTVYYCLAKFSTAGVPGAGVIVILPVARDYLGLDETSTALLSTIYILKDPILTSSNIFGNGAFAMVTHRLLKPWVSKEKNTSQTSHDTSPLSSSPLEATRSA